MISTGHPVGLALLSGEVEDHDLAGRGVHQRAAHGRQDEVREHRGVPGAGPQDHPFGLIDGAQRLGVGLGVLGNHSHVLQTSAGRGHCHLTTDPASAPPGDDVGLNDQG